MSKLLIVDDSGFQRKMTARLFEEKGIDVLQAEGGKECIKICKSETVKCILTDLQMPEMDGFELIATLRNDGFTIPIVALSGRIPQKERERLEGLGATDVIYKPINSENIDKVLKHL